MCELFAKSSRKPATVNMSLDEFAAHGGRTGPNKDGWGIAYYEEGDVRLIKDTNQASTSAWVRFVEDQALTSATVISHIRYATTGNVALYNTHPFSRELGGRMHVLAHNGVVNDVIGNPRFPLDPYHPVGETDSEYAFCALLTRLKELWHRSSGVPDLDDRMVVVSDFAADLRELGRANFLYSDGDILFAHAHMRLHEDGTAAPGLHMFQRADHDDGLEVEGGGVSVSSRHDDQAIVVLASVPLTADKWTALAEGTLLALRGGEIVAQAAA
jgi:glutamine amidotransferase